MLLHGGTPRTDFASIFLLLVLLLLSRMSVLRAFDTTFIGGLQGDAGLYVWLVKSNLRDLFTLPWFNTNAFYPYTLTLAWSDNFILPSFVIGALGAVGMPLAASYNLVILTAQFLNGVCTYLLCRELTGKPLPALTAAVGFMSWSFLGAHMGHPQLQFAFWLPLSLLCTFRFMRFPRTRSAVCLGLCFSAAFLCTVYYAVFIALLSALLLGSVILMRPQRFRQRHYLRFGAGIIIGIIPMIPFLWPYLQILSTFGGRNIYEAYYFSATPLSYLSASSWSWLYGQTAPLSHAEANLLPGFVVFFLVWFGVRRVWDAPQLTALKYALIAALGLLFVSSLIPGQMARYLGALCSWFAIIFAVLLLKRLAELERRMGFAILTNRGLLGCIALCALILFLISLGPLGNPEKGHFALGVFRFFYETVPGFGAIRAVSRIGIVVVLCLLVLSALSLSYMIDRSKLRAYVVVLPLLLLVAENQIDRYPLESEVPAGSVFEQLERLPRSNEAVLILPWTEQLKEDGRVESWGAFARYNVQYMHWAFSLERPLVNGYSGQRSKIMREYPKHFRTFPSAPSIRALQSIVGLRYVVYVSRFDPAFNPSAFQKQVQAFKEELEYLGGDDSGNHLFRVKGSRRLTDEYSLLVPSYPNGTVTLEFVAPSSGVAEAHTIVEIFNSEQPEEPVASTIVRLDGQPALFSFAVPSSGQRVRPLKLIFKVQDNLPVFLTGHRYNH